MDKKYFIQRGKEKLGKFSVNELSEHITHDTYVWCAGMADWKKASEVDELSNILEELPPPLPKNNKESNELLEGLKRAFETKNLNILYVIFLVSYVALFLFIILTHPIPYEYREQQDYQNFALIALLINLGVSPVVYIIYLIAKYSNDGERNEEDAQEAQEEIQRKGGMILFFIIFFSLLLGFLTFVSL